MEEAGNKDTRLKHDAAPLIFFKNLFEEAKETDDNLSIPPPHLCGLARVATYRVQNNVYVTVVCGNLEDFCSPIGAVVIPCNEGGLLGGSTDEAITKTAGNNLRYARRHLPLENGIRCPIGHCKLLGPSVYGQLLVNHVVLAAGPDFRECNESKDYLKAEKLLSKTYRSVLELLNEVDGVLQVAFPIISASKCSGPITVDRVLEIAILEVLAWARCNIVPFLEDRDIVFCIKSNEMARKFNCMCNNLLKGCIKAEIIPVPI